MTRPARSWATGSMHSSRFCPRKRSGRFSTRSMPPTRIIWPRPWRSTRRSTSTHQSITRVVEFTDLEKQSKRILDLGIQLSEAHQQSIDLLQSQNIKSLNILRFELLGSLALLMSPRCWLAVVVYRDMIAPLQVQLVESRQLVERQEKLASLGMLAAGVAHEIRNPLTAIKAWLYLQQKHLQARHAGTCGCRADRRRNQPAGTHRQGFFAVRAPVRPAVDRRCPRNSCCAKCKRCWSRNLKNQRSNSCWAGSCPAQIRIDPQQIKQVLINLIQNAADSIGEDGTVTLRARLDEKRLNDRQTDVVILEVTDTGKGIPPRSKNGCSIRFSPPRTPAPAWACPSPRASSKNIRARSSIKPRLDYGTTFGIILPLHKP